MNAGLHFEGTERFQVLRLLGQGGMGEVYEAFDRSHGTTVALKILRRIDPRLLYRFKQEFRALQDLHHPNLVALGELHESRGLWFFTMERIDGVDAITHVRGVRRGGDRCDLHRLRLMARQLFEALVALHGAGKIHRDIKPSNVLVTDTGRAVLLDFGLVTDIDPALQSVDGEVVGTPAYMAPEQAASKLVDAACDVYGMGTLIFEALTGRLPFEGGVTELLIRKQTTGAPDPRAFTADCPDELAELCRRLLAIEPGRRPTAAEALAVLTGTPDRRPAPRVTLTRTAPFVGRSAELTALRAAAVAVIDRHEAGVVHLEGQSGVGKSALCTQFLTELRGSRDDLFELSGRCYERELTHYRAFDGVVDALVRRLWSVPDEELERLTPRDAAFLSRMFPMFDGVRSFAHALRAPTVELDARKRASGALRQLLSSLASRWLVVIAIDDLQWADTDSLRLLAELLRPPAPPVLVVVTSRASDGEDGPARRAIDALEVPVRRLEVTPLAPADALELARALVGAAGVAAEQAPAIAREAAGHPLHIAELVRHAGEVTPSLANRPRLDEAIVERLARLPVAARDLAELIAVAGAPVAPATLRRAAEINPTEFTRALAVLRAGFLARRSGAADRELIEPYHDRVREALVARIEPERRRVLHERLASAMTAAGDPPEMLLRHLEGAGQLDRAAQCAIEAAQRASAAMAYDRAAELYRSALRMGRHDGDALRALRIRLGEELLAAGHGREAATVLAQAAEGAEPVVRLECRRKAAEALLISGYIDEGEAAIAALLAEVGTPLPRTPRRALVSLIANRVALAVRGRSWTLRTDHQVPRETLSRLDVYKAVSYGLSMVDNVRGADFNARYLRLAVRTGEPIRLCRALGTEAIFQGSQGGRGLVRARAMVTEVEQLAAVASSSYALAYAQGASGCLEYFDGRFNAAAATLGDAEGNLRAARVTEGYEINNVRMFRGFSLVMAGEVAELAPLFALWLADAEVRGDRYIETVLRRRCVILQLASGDVAGARDSVSRARWTPPEGRYHLQHWYEVMARTEIALCAGEGGAAVEALTDALGRLRASMLDRVQTVRIQAWSLYGRASVAQGPSGVKAARRAASRLRGESFRTAPVLRALIEAGAWAQAGDRPAAVASLREAVAVADADSGLYAAAAQLRLGVLIGGEEGASLTAAAIEACRARGVTSPETIARLLAPGFD